MTIDLDREQTLTITEAAKALPNRPHVSTLWRWVYRGHRGVKLETVNIGGRRLTSREALSRFIEKTTAAANDDAIPVRTARSRERDIQAAERELAAAGI